jgi:hypothetical protein
MAVGDVKFAEKTTSFAPLTGAADSFSAHTFARPDFKSGRVVVANFEFPESSKITAFRPSYTRNGQQPEQGAPE